MNIIDKFALAVSPKWALKRENDRMLLQAYEAAKPSRIALRKTDHRSGDAAVSVAGRSLRGQARYYDQNYDTVIAIFDAIETVVVGAEGLRVEPLPLTLDGDVHEDFARELSSWYEQWSLAPESTGELTRPEMERLLCRSWVRDGEVFEKFILGKAPGLVHGSEIPFSIECLEADFLPDDFSDTSLGITQGIQRNAWGRPTGYHFYKNHPGDLATIYNTKTIRVPADRIQHLKHVNRLRQARGVSILHGVLSRIEDIKSYEESERVAARVAAALTAYIKRGNPDSYEGANKDEQGNRLLNIAPGTFIDNLQPGEEVGTIQSNRPSTLLHPFLDTMKRALSAGTRTTASTITRNYEGSYSSKRQELVEGFAGYQVLQNKFIGTISRPNYRMFNSMAILSKKVKLPKDVDPRTIQLAAYIAPVMPWIDPDKESKAHERDVKAGFNTEANVIRSKGLNPHEVKKKRAEEIKFNREHDLKFSSDASNDSGAVISQTPETENEGDNDAEE